MKRILKSILILTALLCCTEMSAQRKVSADVEVKSVFKGSVTTVTKSVYCSSNGRLVTYFHSPQEYYMITNAKGEALMYMPSTNEVLSQTSEDLSSREELLSLFLSGRTDDLGLSIYGYKLISTTREDGLVKKTFTSTNNRGVKNVEIVFENYLPIYCAYIDAGGRTESKTYFSSYVSKGRFTFPERVTSITYSSAKDSSVTRSIYSNIQVDDSNPLYDFEVPQNAKVAKLPVIKKK